MFEQSPLIKPFYFKVGYHKNSR